MTACDDPAEAVLVGAPNPPTTTTLPTIPPPPPPLPPPPPPTIAPVVTTPTVAPVAATATTSAQNQAVRALVVTGGHAARLARLALIMLAIGALVLSVAQRTKRRGASPR